MKIDLSKKSLIFFIKIILILNVIAIPVSAIGDVAYIFKNKAKVDNNILDIFEDLSLEVDLINERKLPDLSDYKIVYLGDERFRKSNRIKIWKYPVIISNYYYGDGWGITDDGVSKLASNVPLSVKKGNDIIQVYNKARYYPGGISIPYYYLANDNKANDLIQVASTYTGDYEELGDVISYGGPGTKLFNGMNTEDNICFFGVIESDFWTEETRDLFKECVQFVGAGCENDGDCRDTELGEPYCEGRNILQDVKEGQCKNSGTVRAQCVDDVVSNLVKVCSRNCQDAQCVCFDNDNDGFDDCNIREDGDDGKRIDCADSDFNINPGALEICDGKDNDCDGNIDENNGHCSNVEVCTDGSCVNVVCNQDIDCGVNGFINGSFCQEDDVFQNFKTHTCNNPGTVNSFCSQNIDKKMVVDCSDICVDSKCIGITCKNDLDCNDHNPKTNDRCNYPGTVNSICSYKDIVCLTNLDCNDNNDYTKDICKFPNTTNSFCKYDDIECIFDNDCDDYNDFTRDTCNLPGSVNSSCSFHDVVCLTDFDCGVDGFVDELFCQQNDVYQNFRKFKCENPGTSISTCSQIVSPKLVNVCLDTCINGSCVEIVCNNDLDCDDDNSNTVDFCENPGTVNSSCTHEGILCVKDKDCGTDRFTGGLFCQGKDIYRDYLSFQCNNPNQQSSFCSNDINSEFVFACTYACSEGSCVRCKSALDCDDNDDRTVDICRFPASVDSFCSYDSISCIKDFDCGVDSFVGAPFCQNDDVYQKYREFSCNNSGSSGSFCSDGLSTVLLEECNFGCNSGKCLPEIEIECYIDSDCGNDGFIGDETCSEIDNNVHKDFIEYTCNNPGLDRSFCSNEITSPVIEDCNGGQVCDNAQCVDVQCNDDFDCGFDIFIEVYCEDNKVFQDSHIPLCLNSGSSNSQCVEDIVTELVEVCSSDEICTDGVCIPVECTQDSDCGTDGFIGDLFCQDGDVYQNFQSFNCNNPGTSLASCSSFVESEIVEICIEGSDCEDGQCVEVFECSDGLDNDNDNTIDFPDDLGCVDPEDDDECIEQFEYTMTVKINGVGSSPAGLNWEKYDEVCIRSDVSGCIYNTIFWRRPSSVVYSYVVNNCNFPGIGFSQKASFDLRTSGTPFMVPFCLWERQGGVPQDNLLGHAGTGSLLEVNCKTSEDSATVSVVRPTGHDDTFSRGCVQRIQGLCTSDICLFGNDIDDNACF